MQRTDVPIHPKPDDMVGVLQTISVVLGKIDKPLCALANRFDSKEISDGLHDRLDSIRKLSTQWASIISVTSGKEAPSASDLFTIYTAMLDFQDFGTRVTREDRLTGTNADLIKEAVNVIQGQTELLKSVATLQYAVADKIELEESLCHKAQRSKTSSR